MDVEAGSLTVLVPAGTVAARVAIPSLGGCPRFANVSSLRPCGVCKQVEEEEEEGEVCSCFCTTCACTSASQNNIAVANNRNWLLMLS